MIFDLEIIKQFNIACREMVKLDPSMMKDGEELLRFAENHERRQPMLVNLTAQIHGYEKNYGRKRVGPQAASDRNQIIAATAQLFMKAIKLQRDQSLLSAAEKSRVANEGALKKEVKELLVEVP